MGIDPISILISMASMAYQQSQYRKQKRAAEAAADKRKGQKFSISGQATPLPVIYGKQAIGGINVKYKIRDSYTGATSNADATLEQAFGTSSQTGAKNEFLLMQTALCHGGIEGVKHIMVGGMDYRGSTKDMEENEASYTHRFELHNDGGTACAVATANGFPSTDLFTGAAHVTSAFKLNRDNPQYNGIPDITYQVKGRKVRTVINSGGGVYTLNATYAYSNNPVWCLLDYLLNAEFGRGLSVNDIHLESFYNAGVIANTTVMTNALVAGQVNGIKPVFGYPTQSDFPASVEPYQEDYLYQDDSTGNLYSMTEASGVPTYSITTAPGTGSIPLYEANLTLDTGASVRDNINRFLDCMGMADFVWTPEGKYKLIMQYPTSQSEVNALISETFDENNIVRDTVSISWPNAQDRFNQVTVSFDNEFEDFASDSVSWPPTYSSVYSTYLTEDNNQPMRSELTGEGVTTPYHALALAEQTVRKSRSIYTLSFMVNKDGLAIEPGDLIKVSIDSMDISNEIFRVESIEVQSDFSVKVSCFYFDYTSLSWNISDDASYGVSPVLGFEITPPSNVAFNTTGDLLGTASGKVTWTAADDVSVREYIVEVSSNSGSTYTEIGRTSGTTLDVSGLQAGTYDFSVKSNTIQGRLSNRVIAAGNTVQLKTTSKVAIIYANTADAATNTQSYTVGSNEFVAYYEYDSTLPTLPVTSGINFSLFVGPAGSDGADGADGADGTNGTNGYTPVKGVDYFDGVDGADGSDGDSAYQAWLDAGNSGSTTDFLNDLVGADGADGTDGIAGTNGVDGTTTYTWVKYADNGTGTTGFTNSPTGKDYIGFAFNKTTATESTNPADYTWSLIKGADGADGADGTDGTNGTNGTDGDDGVRGPGWWRYETGTSASTAGLSNAALDAFFATATGLSKVAGDRFIVVNTSDVATGYLRNNGDTSWVEQAEFIDGNLLVDGTVTADALAVNSVTANKIQVSADDSTIYSVLPTATTSGTVSSGATGMYFNGSHNRIEIWESGILRVLVGDTAFTPSNNP